MRANCPYDLLFLCPHYYEEDLSLATCRQCFRRQLLEIAGLPDEGFDHSIAALWRRIYYFLCDVVAASDDEHLQSMLEI
ncbi:hypothetical protein [Thermogutta sp.]|uniref:hypothetical protein n=1 Tax=Thermogutta sp. TaxID=1962930 RepID=UPI003220826C